MDNYCFIFSLSLLPSFGSGVVRLQLLCCAPSCLPLLRPHRFAVVSPVCGTRCCVHPALCLFVTVLCRVLNRAANQQFLVRRKPPTASKRRSPHEDVKRLSQEATTECLLNITILALILGCCCDTLLLKVAAFSPTRVTVFYERLHSGLLRKMCDVRISTNLLAEWGYMAFLELLASVLPISALCLSEMRD